MIYIAFFVIMVFLLLCNTKETRLMANILFMLMLCLRYKVGTDYEQYELIFETQTEDFMEPFHILVSSVIRKFHGNAGHLFAVYGMLSSFFLYRFFENFKYKNKYIPVITYLLLFPFFCNGIRQALALTIFMYSTQFIEKRKFLLYLICVVCATLVHTSLIIVLPLYFVNRKFDTWVYVIVYFLSFILIGFNLDQLLSPLNDIIDLSKKYSAHVEHAEKSLFSFGLFAQLFWYIVFFVLALWKKFFNKYPLLFNLFFFAAVSYNLRLTAIIFVRLEYNFVWALYVMTPLLLSCDLFKKERLLLPILRATFFVLIVSIIIKSYFFTPSNIMIPYQFIFNN